MSPSGSVSLSISLLLSQSLSLLLTVCGMCGIYSVCGNCGYNTIKCLLDVWGLRLNAAKWAFCMGLCISLSLSLSLSLCFSPLSHSLAHFICCSLKRSENWSNMSVQARFSSRKTIWYICFFINSAWIETATWQSNSAQPKTVAQLKWIPFSWNFKWAFMLREIPITAQPKAQPGQQQQH